LAWRASRDSANTCWPTCGGNGVDARFVLRGAAPGTNRDASAPARRKRCQPWAGRVM